MGQIIICKFLKMFKTPVCNYILEHAARVSGANLPEGDE